MQQRGEDAEDLPLLLDRDPDRREGLLRRRKLFGIVDARDRERVRAALVQVRERRGRLEPERLAFRGGGAGEELVKDVIVALCLGLVDETRSLEEVSPDSRADDGLTAVKEDLKWPRRSSVASVGGRDCFQDLEHTWMYLPNRDELSLRVVLALPNASMIGLVARICSSTSDIPAAVVC